MVEQRRARKACTYAQTHQSIICLHTQSMDVKEESGVNLDRYHCLIRKHGSLNEAFVQMQLL